MKKQQQAPNLVPYMSILTANEKAVLCNVLNYGHNEGIHQGVLPFVSHAKAVVRLATQITRSTNTRIFRQIQSKLVGADSNFVQSVRFSMRLDDIKVYRRFGPHPERGKPLPFLGKEKVTVGLKFSLPKRAYVPDKDVLVSPCVTLKRQSQGLWQVEVLARCQATVEDWLITNCQ